MDSYLTLFFALNLCLTIIDAAVGYHAAPVLIRVGAADSEISVDGVRSMLGLVVGLYSFFSCLAFFNHRPGMLLVVSAVIIADIAAQLAIYRKLKSRRD